MTVTLSASSVTATTAILSLAGYGADGTVDIQLASRPDFSFCVAPTISIARQASFTLTGLNQDSTIYARARGRSAAGVIDRWGDTEAFRTSLATARVTAAQTIMIDPAMLVFPVPILSATSPQTIAGYPADNIAVPAPVAWRAQPASGQPIVSIDLFIPGEAVDTIAILNTNVPEAATVTIQASNSFNALDAVLTNAPFRASANMPGRDGYHGIFRFASLNARCWRITITAPGGGGPPASLFHVEHIVLGRNITTRNVNGDKTETPIGLTTTERTRTGILDRVPGMPLRRTEFDLSNLTEQDFETLYGRLWRRQGDTVFCLPNSRNNAFRHDRMLLGEFGAGRISGVQGIRFTRSVSIDSII